MDRERERSLNDEFSFERADNAQDVCVCVRARARARGCVCVCVCVRVCTCMHTCMHTCKHACMRVHACIHAYIQFFVPQKDLAKARSSYGHCVCLAAFCFCDTQHLQTVNTWACAGAPPAPWTAAPHCPRRSRQST